MQDVNIQQAGSDPSIQTRIGIAKLTKLAFDRIDLTPLRNALLEEVAEDPANTGALMDLSVIAQLLGDQEKGLELQSQALKHERLYRSPCAVSEPGLRVLALAAETDIGGNTPIEFLLEDSDIELYIVYVVPGLPLRRPLPPHDVAIVIVPGSASTRATLAEVDRLVRSWPRPVLNRPRKIAELDRHRLHALLGSISNVDIPGTARIGRDRLLAIGQRRVTVRQSLEDGAFPLIVRPIDSHAGRGLAKLDTSVDVEEYLAERPEAEFFISRYVDYRSADGLFRKYRIALVGGQPYACHMAISDQWRIWYLNAEMAQNPGKRAEEEHFITHFDSGFAQRHRPALAEIARRVDLEYFAIDCAETRSGDLLIFEADNAMIVHDMDPPALFPYKSPQMKKIFGAFSAMLKASKANTTARAVSA